MSQILNKVREVDPNDSEAVKDVVNTFFLNISKIDNSDAIKWLRSLEDVINRFPKYCMSHRGTIEAIITEAIDSSNNYYVIEAAKCAQALQQVRPSQEKTATPKTSWCYQMNLLCDSAHSLISAIFPNAVDMYTGSKNAKNQEQESNSSLTAALLKINSVNNMKNKGEKQTLLQTRLRNIFCFIQAMLVEIYPVAKPIRPQIILDVVVRALSVSSNSNTGVVDVADIKIESIRTLDALVLSIGPNLIPFSPLVFRLLMQTFTWTSDNSDKDFSNVRCTAYNSMSMWLNTLHSHRSAADTRSSWEDALTNHIINDIAQPEKIVELTIGPQPTKHMSKKAKRKLANAKLLESSIATHMPGERNKISLLEEVNNAVALAALECAETFLLVCGRFLKPATHKLFQERTIRECYNARNSDKVNEQQLLMLLRVVEATRQTTPANVPPPTQYCMQLYSILVNCGCSQVSKFCTQALLEIRLHLHCSPPSLNFELDAPQEKQNTGNKRKKISEKNITALKTLLGPDRMAAMAVDEQVVTIPDEPTTKKAKLDKEDDKISVSSESINSVDTSDDSDVQEIGPDYTEDETDAAHKEIEEIVKEIHIIGLAAPNIDSVIDIVAMDEKTSEHGVTDKPDVIDVDCHKHVTDQPIAVNVKDTVTDKPEDVVDSNMEDITKESANDNISEIDVEKKVTIHEATTQIPLNESTDTTEGEDGPLSSEIAYDYPKSGTVKLNDDINDALPCSNETDDDDHLITCGQAVKSSQETCPDKQSDDTDVSMGITLVPKVNGNVSENKIIHNGVNIPVDKVSNSNDGAKNVESGHLKVDESESNTLSKEEVTIEEMMADFVDEVNEDIIVT